MPLPWFKRGIFQHFVFDEATQKNLECLPNMVGQCSLCITRKSVGGVYDKCKELSMLDKNPTIKSLFIKYNTAIPSCAPVERLFSVASLVLTARRSRLSDTLLEHLILLKMYRNL